MSKHSAGDGYNRPPGPKYASIGVARHARGQRIGIVMTMISSKTILRLARASAWRGKPSHEQHICLSFYIHPYPFTRCSVVLGSHNKSTKRSTSMSDTQVVDPNPDANALFYGETTYPTVL